MSRVSLHCAVMSTDFICSSIARFFLIFFFLFFFSFSPQSLWVSLHCGDDIDLAFGFTQILTFYLFFFVSLLGKELQIKKLLAAHNVQSSKFPLFSLDATLFYFLPVNRTRLLFSAQTTHVVHCRGGFFFLHSSILFCRLHFAVFFAIVEQ